MPKPPRETGSITAAIRVLSNAARAKRGGPRHERCPILQLYTTFAEFGNLRERHDRTRSTSMTANVDRQTLIHILMDHAHMLEALRKAGPVDVAEPL